MVIVGNANGKKARLEKAPNIIADKGEFMGNAVQYSVMIENLMQKASKVASYLWEKGWAEANAGNLSIEAGSDLDIQGSIFSEPVLLGGNICCKCLGGRLMLISGTGTRFRDIAENPEAGMCLIRITQDGKAFQIFKSLPSYGGTWPTSELATHLKLQEYLLSTHSMNRVVLHSHPTELVALTHITRFWDEGIFNGIILGMLPEVKIILPEGAGLVDYALPGSERLADATLKKLSEGYRTILWQKHGCLAVSDDPVKAFDMLDILNKGAQVLLACLNAGEMPEGLSKGDLKELEVAFNLK